MRLLTHERAPCASREELETYWGLQDFEEAHLTLDVYEDLQVLARQKK